MKHFLVDIRRSHHLSCAYKPEFRWMISPISDLWKKIPEDYPELFDTSESLTLTSLVSFDPLTRTIELYLMSWKRRKKETTV